MESNGSKMAVFEQNSTDPSLCKDLSAPDFSDTAVKVSLIAILILSFFGNSTVCIIVSRHYQLHTITNAFLVNMAVIHLLFALLSIPPYLRLSSNSSSLQTEKWLCVLIGFTFKWFAALSHLALTLVAIERYYVVNNAGRKNFSAKATGRLIFATCLWTLIFAITWTVFEGSAINCQASSLFTSILPCFPLLSDQTAVTSRVLNIIYILTSFLMPMALMAGSFLKMSKTLWTSSHGIRPMGVGNLKTIRFGAEIKTTRTLLFIFILHICCWLPICTVSFYASSKQQTDRSQLDKLKLVSVCMAFGSSCINPLMYAFRNPRFSIIFRKRSKQRNHKRRVQFHRNQEQLNGQTTKAISWAKMSQSVFVIDASKSDETLTTSSF